MLNQFTEKYLRRRVYRPVLCFQADGKLWVSDVATTRMLRFDSAGLCDAWFMYTAHSYLASVDPNNPKRAFWSFLEFEVDYNKSFTNSWTLKNYWGRTTAAGAPEIARDNFTVVGLSEVTTLTNGRTYAFVSDSVGGNFRRIVELTTNGLRVTGIGGLHPLDHIEADGSRLYNEKSGTTALFYRAYVTGFDGSNNPLFATNLETTVTFDENVHPIGRAYQAIGTTNITFYPNRNVPSGATNEWPGKHLGAVASGAWKWTNAATGTMNGRGNFDPVCESAGSHHFVSGSDVFFAHYGQSWYDGRRNVGLANQIFHYKLDGTFVGQFGLPSFTDGPLLNAPGAAANIFHFGAIRTNGVTYLFTDDEAGHGLHRWRIEP